MNTNPSTQLPAEVIEEIKENADTYAGTQVWVNKNSSPEHLFHEFISATSFERGATEYASTNFEERQLRVHLEKENDIITGHYNELQQKYAAARTLLEKFISRHEAGLLPDMFIYNEIKTFLDGK